LLKVKNDCFFNFEETIIFLLGSIFKLVCKKKTSRKWNSLTVQAMSLKLMTAINVISYQQQPNDDDGANDPSSQ